MVSAAFTGAIITHYETALAAQVVLTAFIPMLMDTGGNCGSQSSVTVIRGLSLGEIQKTALARAVSFGPELLMLDEPCASIDTHATLEIERMLLKSNMERHTTIILVTHDLAQARRVAGRIVLLNHGKVVECSETERFFRHPDREETRKFIEGKLLI